MRTFWQDIRFAARMLRKSPAFTAVAVAALALGVGANTAIFSVFNAVLLRPLPYKEPSQLVLINHNYRKIDLKASVSAPGYAHYRDNAKSFEGVAAVMGWGANLTGDGEPERLTGQAVTPSLFPVLGADAARGRTFAEDEAQPGGPKVVVLSDGLWRRRFASDPNIVGRHITLNDQPYEVVGIMPPGFTFGRELGGAAPDLWGPLAFTPNQLSPNNLTNEFLSVIARLKPGVSAQQAQAELDSIAADLRRQYMQGADESNWGLLLTRFDESVVGDIRKSLYILLGAVGFVLLIACANVANLMLARSAARQKEVAVRTALGASRLRIVRQLLTESVLLALVGGALGLLLAMWGVDVLMKVNAGGIPRAHEVGLDPLVLAFTLGVSLLTGVLFGLLPAFQTSRVNLNDTLKEGGRSGRTVLPAVVRNILVVVEVTLAIVLLVGAGLLIRSFQRLQQVNPGFEPRGVLAMQVSLPSSKYPEQPQRAQFARQMLEQVRALPGVKSASVTSVLPMSSSNQSGSFRIEGQQVPPGQSSPHGDRWLVSEDYFQTMGIRLVRGRFFDARDTAEAQGVVVVDETLARKYWGDEDPVGKRITFETVNQQPRYREVVGLTAHVKHGNLVTETRGQYYVPYAQRATSPELFLAVRTDGDPASLAGAVRGAIRGVDKDMPVFRVTTLERLVSDSLSARRFSMLLLGAFAVLALLLAAVGLYGVMSYMVAQRTHEIGIRMALGAQAGDVMRMVVGQGMLLVVIGVALGLSMAFALTRLMSSLLYGVSATDPLTYVGIALLLSAVAFLASYVPARRAMKVDPMVALRYE